ncbi:MAG: EthD family reductase [Planctomycetes bacterium]|nr:EthD family reductase [Alphaproteobacteria bacterium]MBM4100585.1 EthD family reductase [Planctomycetota bacterium]
MKTHTKRLGILRRKDGITHEEFVNHWLKMHAALCVKLPGLRRYSVNLVDRKRFPHFDYDGFSELWFDSEQDLVAALASPEGKVLLADLPNFAKDVSPIISVEYPILWPS